jgi:hypothetical protein
MLHITEKTKKHLYNLINNYPVYWNNYFLFGSQKPTVIMYKNGVNFTLNGTTYVELVSRAVIENTNYFIRTHRY